MNSLFQAVDKVFESGNITTDAEKQVADRLKVLKEAVDNRRKKLSEAQKAKQANLSTLDKGE